MNTILLIVTVIALATAAGLGVMVWRFYREEGRRTDARIAALNEMALGTADFEAPAYAIEAPVKPRVQAPPRPRVQPAAALDLPLHATSASPRPTTSTLFREPEQASPWGARAVVMGGLGLAAAAVILFTLTARNSAAAHQQTTADAAASVATAPGLELLSLRDTRQNGTLTITGLVQNPRGGAPLTRVVVTAFTFDARGSFLASGRAPLDYTTLQPGDESPFVVSVPVPDTVARYRIGFRGDDGRVIAHVDRRQATTAVAENRP